MSRKLPGVLDHAAALIAAALGVTSVAREPLGPDESEAQYGDDVGVVAALSEGAASQEIGFLMGAAEPHEFEHAATFELIVVGGVAGDRRDRRDEALAQAGAAIEADPTLGGLVNWAELTQPDLSVGERYAAVSATLILLYAAPSALG